MLERLYPIMFLIYSLFFTVGVILAAPYYLWRLRGHILSGADWRERFGFLPDSLQQTAVPRQPGGPAGGPPAFGSRSPAAIWIHAVSVGETLAVTGLVREIQQRYPDRKIFMSHVTPAGRETGEKRLPSAGVSARGGEHAGTAVPPRLAGRFFLPLDWGSCVRRVVKRIQPAVLIIVETELWPNLVRVAHRSGARVVLVNARLSDGSFRGYKRFGFFMRRVLDNVDLVCAQTERDAERFRLLGVPRDRVMVAGNLKFDTAPPQLGRLAAVLKTALREAQRGPVVVAGSTMPGEEELVLQAWQQIRSHFPKAMLILAPRHPNRFEAAAQLLSQQRLPFIRRTELETDQQQLYRQLINPEIMLLNTIGELAGIFEMADVVFVGGSLVPTGGHNVLEPVYWGKPTLFGPFMDNFRDIARMFTEAGAAMQVGNATELARSVIQLLGDTTLQREIAGRAKQLLHTESGVTERVLEQIDRLL